VNDLFAPLPPKQFPAPVVDELITFAADDPQVPDHVLDLLVHLLHRQERLMLAPKPSAARLADARDTLIDLCDHLPARGGLVTGHDLIAVRAALDVLEQEIEEADQ
jgi:hypothetical protein